MVVKTVNKKQIINGLRLGGICEGDIVFMHSALSSIGNVEGGADTVIDAFLEVLGPTGTLSATAMSGDSPFDAATSKCSIGIISETLRLRDGAVRSLRPVHSITAIGAKAAELCAGHEDAETNCGDGTPYTKLRDMGAKIVLVGVDMNRNTTLHTLEDLMDAPYLVERVVDMPTYVKDYVGKKMILKKFPPGHRDFLRFTPVLRENGALTETKIGSAVVKIIDVKKMFEVGLDVLGNDINFFLCDNENCPDCNKWVFGGKADV